MLKERNETAAVLIESWDEGRKGLEIFFKPNKQGDYARKQYDMLHKPVKGVRYGKFKRV